MINFLINYEKSAKKSKNTKISTQLSDIISSFKDDVSDVSDMESNVCLISGDKLIENETIELVCKHKFNYDSIFNEVMQQRRSTRYSYTGISYKIKCPYCRTIQNGILPSLPGKKLVKYVNTPEKYVMKLNKCGYTFISGKKKGVACNKNCHGKYCPQHLKIIEKRKEKEKETQKKQEKLKKTKIHKNEKIKPLKFMCCHNFTRGKNKGKQCEKMILYNESTKNNNGKYYCKNHKNLKINLKT